MQGEKQAQRTFLLLWTAVTAIKLVIAARLPLFVDEAFYWQEGKHLAAAYSDLPGLTAWLTALGTAIGGEHVLAVRAPFLLLAGLLPWLIARIATRWFGATAGWQAGSLAVLMPLSGSLGILALPDVPLAFATVLCAGAGARLLREVSAAAVGQLAFGLAIGALSHYRFVGVIGVGFAALLLLPAGRRMLRDPRVWVALGLGAAAWMPLLAWNLENADAGLRFQLLDRHPWSFQPGGGWFLLIQPLLVTPLLFVAMLQVALRAARSGLDLSVQWRFLGLLGGLSTLGYFAVGFFADTERVSFHWPLPGYLALLPVVPMLLRQWPRGWRIATWATTCLALMLVLGYFVMQSTPRWRAPLAAHKVYNANFAGWDELAAAVRESMAEMPPGSRLLVDNFKSGAELGFALGNPGIQVLDHPLNHQHGRAPQLALWGLESASGEAVPTLLVVGSSELPYKSLLAYYHQLCGKLGPLPAPRVLNVDHGRQRFLMFKLPAQRTAGTCTAPAFAWIDTPVAGASSGRQLQVNGWAFKDGVGLRAVEVLLDGKPVAQARYGLPSPGTAAYWKISNDPNHPQVGFSADLDLASASAGRHWLGLRLHGQDGSVEDWLEQPLDIAE
ncbi:MAG: glycosyltransferase family 39 protein [Pseudoxanthomonas sp.]|nr:glycosyltransferase family 39 protein [Pseudoxanthomonas sp.]